MVLLHFLQPVGPSRVNKFPLDKFGVCSFPKGVVPLVAKRSQELESNSLLEVPQNNLSGFSSLMRVISLELDHDSMEDFNIDGFSLFKLASI